MLQICCSFKIYSQACALFTNFTKCKRLFSLGIFGAFVKKLSKCTHFLFQLYVQAFYFVWPASEYFNRATQSPRYHVAEQQAQCSDQEVRCRLSPTLVCIHYEKLCDAKRDCPGGEDEQNCGFEIPQVPVTTPR